ncbi:MAG TPA: chemotaxis protein CheW [Polyangiaceae bacterium]|jgi:purine-binding chemotaxis protein CheW|nr:chemotaxis protein CheW [Polyangiaceae bacterium]
MNEGRAPSPADTEKRKQQVLLCEVGSLLCGFALESVIETMRALPIEQVAAVPSFVSGLSIVRGQPVPVVDLPALLGVPREVRRARFVLVKAGDRRVALAVSNVLGTRSLPLRSLPELPPLLGSATAEFVNAIASLDAQLFLTLESGRLVPNSVWAELDLAGARS